MVNKDDIIKEILLEVSFRSDEGYPNFSKPTHISILSEVLTEMGLTDVKYELIKNLLKEDKEETFTAKNKESGETAVFKSKEARDNAIKAGTHEPVDKKDDDPKKKKSGKITAKDFADRPDIQKKEKQDGEDSKKSNPSFNTEKQKPQIGKVSDIDDEYSDGSTKQMALEYGTKNKKKFKPAPGNAGSMLGEIMSGEGFSHLDENPDLTDDELTQKIYDQVENTTLGKENGGKANPNKKGKYEGKKEDLWKKCASIARSTKTKYQENQKGIDRLESEGKITKPVKVRNFYGHETSISQQVKLIESINGPIYTKEGIEVPKEVVIDLINKSGKGENPSDTSTITVDKDGRALVTFHSDKLSTADIQANSTPNKEAELAIEIVDKTNLPYIIKEDVKRAINDGNKKLQQKEEQLKSAANQPAREMSNGDVSEILKNAQNDTNSDGTPNKDKTSTKLNDSLGKEGKTHKNIEKYLPDGVDPTTATQEQKMKAFLDYMGDDNKTEEPIEKQVQLLYRVAAQQGYNISKDLSRIRMESLTTQRETHKKLNEKNHTLPSGKIIPVGDYIEGVNLIEKLHLNVMDGEKNEKGVGKYPGLFNLNMGGTLVEGDELKKCIDVDGTDDFIESFEVGTPGDGEEVTKNTKTGAITGRNIFVFAITKAKKRIKVAYKTQRSKQGQSGKLSTTYQWDNGIQDCFKS